MSSCKAVDTPASSSSKLLLTSDAAYSDPTRYRQIVGALQYLTFTRPDICYAVNKVCQFMHSPTDGHWSLVKRIVRYLHGTAMYGLHITRGSSLSLHGFTDVVWAGSLDDRKSTGVYLYILVTHLFLGNLENNAQWLVHRLKQNIRRLLMVLLRFYGFGPYYPIFVFPQIL